MRIPSFVLITGASSGIGAALAEDYARLGSSLYLVGRDVERLEDVALRCQSLGARVETFIQDVTDADGMDEIIESIEARVPLDVVIANAGIGAPPDRDVDLHDHSLPIFTTNVDGVLYTLHPAIRHMRKRQQGHVAIIASLAGYFGMGDSPAYSASKAAVKVYGEGLRQYLEPEGVKVSVICPGFVQSPLTDRNNFPMPFLQNPYKAARIIRDGIAANKARIAFPWQLSFVVWFLSCLPASWRDAVARRMTTS